MSSDMFSGFQRNIPSGPRASGFGSVVEEEFMFLAGGSVETGKTGGADGSFGEASGSGPPPQLQEEVLSEQFTDRTNNLFTTVSDFDGSCPRVQRHP
jgi:hypothetical protein